ncbi:MAG: hypothetical protein IPM63_03715 [Acidobacteriota bacterium]|nr:MAG: hypothetical protein IPM63_03715 [Acidobacteriota bacterium]
MTARDHNRLLGIFFLINGGLSVLGGAIFALIYGGMGTMMLTSVREREAQTVGGIFIILAVVISAMILIFSVFYLVTGWKIYKEAPVGRILGIIASILCIMNFPLGTALGIYGIWFFFGDMGKAFYESGTTSHVPPPPSSWQ